MILSLLDYNINIPDHRFCLRSDKKYPLVQSIRDIDIQIPAISAHPRIRALCYPRSAGRNENNLPLFQARTQTSPSNAYTIDWNTYYSQRQRSKASRLVATRQSSANDREPTTSTPSPFDIFVNTTDPVEQVS